MSFFYFPSQKEITSSCYISWELFEGMKHIEVMKRNHFDNQSIVVSPKCVSTSKMNWIPSWQYQFSVAGWSPSSWAGVRAKSFLNPSTSMVLCVQVCWRYWRAESSLFSFIYLSRHVFFKRFSENVRIPLPQASPSLTSLLADFGHFGWILY